MTAALAGIVASLREDSPAVAELGLLSAFVGPFAGMARAVAAPSAPHKQVAVTTLEATVPFLHRQR
jgi:hypothetical protein